MTITGACLCGAVRFEASVPPRRVTHCHCGMCRRASGAAVATFATFESDKVRLLYHLSEDFESFSAGAAWDDAKLGLQHWTSFERMAVVTDVGWVKNSFAMLGFDLAWSASDGSDGITSFNEQVQAVAKNTDSYIADVTAKLKKMLLTRGFSVQISGRRTW